VSQELFLVRFVDGEGTRIDVDAVKERLRRLVVASDEQDR
jgi:hypothetical protein